MSEQFPKVQIGENSYAAAEADIYFEKYIEPHIPKGWPTSAAIDYRVFPAFSDERFISLSVLQILILPVKFSYCGGTK